MADEIRAEMVANVWKVVAAEGDNVDGRRHAGHPGVDEDGDPGAGRGRPAHWPELAVAEGDVIQEGDLIARVEWRPARSARPYVMRSTPGSGDQSRSGVRTKPSRR